MRLRLLPVALAATLCFLAAAGSARAARQAVAVFPLQNLSDNAIASDVSRLGQSLKDKLQDRLDVLPVTGMESQDPDQVRKKARGIGATYVLTGAVSRIGRTFTLDLTLAATEDPGKGRTIVVNGTGDIPAGGTGGLPPVFSRMAIEAAAKLKYQFFGDELVGEGKDRRKIPKLTGTISRSRNVEGDVISVARGDTDRDGKTEVVAAYADGITIYRVDGDDLYEKTRLPDAGQGFIHLDVADIDGNGTPEIVAVRYIAGKALSDIWEYNGAKYQRIYRDVPYFVRTLDLGKGGIALVGQESDPRMIFKGPVYRLALSRYGQGGNKERESALPLPEGTWIYAFTTLKKGSAIRFVTLTGRERLVLFDDAGRKLWESIDAVSGTEISLDAPIGVQGRPDMVRRIHLPNRLFAADLLGDRNDELIVLNNLVTAGGFFESLRVFSNSEALCFAQDGDSLQLAWRTPQAGGSARDAFVDSPKGGSPFRIGVASIDKGKLLGKFGEWRILWLK
ncbi:MAG: VCBS repeat-containing protein [Deltaproteobacteria bacterium]|nr:VCBS repeat-containing protein [Deltaproteobacteria bacterium]PWB62340.1 MAG: hypothetical protein C3F14_10030 [Deltaproteobacteria bacterium]